MRFLVCLAGLSVVFFLVLLGRYGMNAQELSSTVTVGLAGDVMLGRLVDQKLQEVDPAYVWGDLIDLLVKPNLTLVNLETAFTLSQRAVPKIFNFRSHPRNVRVLKIAGIDVVSLANNHVKDFGDEGLRDTLETLDKAEILHVGAGLTKQDAEKPVIMTKNGIRFGILAATDNEPAWAATENSPGINYFHTERLEPLKQQIITLKPHVDIVIISLHWGPNMRERPTGAYIDAAHALVDVGADIIHGHSAHIFQGVEVYKDKLILYDTGDFLDDYHVDSRLRNDRSFFYTVEVASDGIRSLQVTPVVIDAMQVRIAHGQDYDWSMRRIRDLSQEFGTIIDEHGFCRVDQASRKKQ